MSDDNNIGHFQTSFIKMFNQLFACRFIKKKIEMALRCKIDLGSYARIFSLH